MQAADSVRNAGPARTASPQGLAGAPLTRSKKAGSASVQRLMNTYLRPLEEARGLPAAHFTQLPYVTVLELEVPGWSGPVWLRSDAAVSIPGTDVVLGSDVWSFLVEAAEADRIYLADLRALLARVHSGEVLTRDDVVGPVRAERPRQWTVGQVLARIGARLFSVRVEESPSKEPMVSANTPAFQEAG